MKHYIRQFWLVMAVILLISGVDILAQKTQVTGGTSFWLAIPKCNRSQNEGLKGSLSNSATELFITARTKANVKIYNSSGGLIGNPVVVDANSSKVVGLNATFLEHQTSGQVEQKGIYVESDEPISLVVYIGYNWTGEAFRIVPVDWLGTEYYTLNLHNDYCKMYDGTTRDLPNQILIVATEDNTKVEYVPKYDILNGAKKDQTGTIMMNKGESVVLFSKTSVATRQLDATDLSGTNIKADKKIAVYSGHTKGSYPKFNPTYYGGLKADFLRNMLFDSMWPNSLLGTEYVTAPFIYYGRQEYEGYIDGEIGDIVRFVATRNNTFVSEVMPDGTVEILKTGLKAGECYDLDNKCRTRPGVYKTNYPTLVGQYGKGYMWWGHPPVYKDGKYVDKEGNEIQNPSKTGQGLLVASTPVSQWANYSAFLAVPAVNNHFNLTFRSKDKDSINYMDKNGVVKLISKEFKSDIKDIPGTEYSYISGDIATGLHSFEGVNAGITFAVYSYGDMDAYKSGFSYGYPTASNYYTPCNDTILLTYTQQCDEINGTVNIEDLQTDVSCASLRVLSYIQSTKENCTFIPDYTPDDKYGSFRIVFQNKSKPGKITVKILTKSGNQILKDFVYEPDVIVPELNVVEYGTLVVGQPETKQFYIQNMGKNPVHIVKLYLKSGLAEFTITSTPTTDFWLQPGEKKDVSITALVTKQNSPTLAEQLWVKTDCIDVKLTDLNVSSGAPDIRTTDIDFGVIPITVSPNPQTKEFTIQNVGNNPAVITGRDRSPNLSNFICTDLDQYNVTNPLILKPNEIKTIKVTYDHQGQSGITHIDTLRLTSTNTTVTKLYSVWKATPIKGDLTITSADWGKQRVIDNYVKANNLTNPYVKTVTITNSGTNDVNIKDIKIYEKGTSVELTDNVFGYAKSEFTNITNNILKQGQSVTLTVTFAPVNQQSYEADVIVYGYYGDNNSISSNRGLLAGKGIQPHVITNNVDFGVLNLDSEPSRTKNVVFTVTNPVPGFDQDLTITGLKLKDNTVFKISGTFNFPMTIKTGDSLVVPVTFTPLSFSATPYTDVLSIESDVNINTAVGDYKDITSSTLTGNAFSTDVATTDLDFGIRYKGLTYPEPNEVAHISFKNLNSEGTSLYLINTIDQLWNQSNTGLQPADNPFTPVRAYIDSPANIVDIINTDNLEIKPGQTLYIDYEFRPLEVKKYQAKMVYRYSLNADKSEYGNAVSTIKGEGKNHLAVVEIAKGYKANPGAFASLANTGDYVEVKFYKDANEGKALNEAKIDMYELNVTFGDATLEALGKHFHPYYTMVNGKPDYKAAINLSGTMSEGWEILSVDVVNLYTLNIKLRGNGKVLASGNNDVLMKIKMLGYLSTADVKIPFKPAMHSSADVDAYLTISSVDGDGVINKVCLDNERLIEFTGKNYKISNPTPNPVVNSTIIEYTTPIDAPVLIELYNAAGAKVATLLDEVKKAGDYKLNVDVNKLGLSSGTYNYKVVMGPYSSVKPMVVTK